MKKDTTLYINDTVLNLIDDAVVKTGVKRNDIFIKLIEFAIKDNVTLRTNRTSVKYQKSDPDSIWNTVHVRLPEVTACFCLDMRRFYCKSVSLILAYSVGKFLEDLINMLLGIDPDNNIADNYRFKSDNFEREELGNRICWRKYWKVPTPT